MSYEWERVAYGDLNRRLDTRIKQGWKIHTIQFCPPMGADVLFIMED